MRHTSPAPLCPARPRPSGRCPSLLPLALALALALGLAAPAVALELPFGRDTAPAAAPAPRPVVTEIVAPNDSAPGRSVPGVITAATEVQMAFQTLGRMIARPVDVGDRVDAGQVLARLDPEDLAGNTRAAEASLAAAQVNLTTARNTAERARSLSERNVASAAQLEQAEQALSAARSAVDQAQARLESARDAEGYAVMTAPISGVVSAVRATPGAVVAAGDPILTLSSEDELEATIDLTETQLQGIERGTECLIFRDHQADEPVRGRVNRISPVADRQTRTRRVYITLPPGSSFRLGSLVRVRRADDSTAALTVPAEALVAEPPGGVAVWIVRRSGPDAATVTRRTVTIGARIGARIEVTEGLAPGDEVVIRGVHSLAEGQQVGRKVEP